MTRSSTAGPRKEANGTWTIVVNLGRDEHGRRRQAKRRGFATKKEAQEEMDKLRRAVSTATYVAPATMTFREYLDAWLAGLPARGLRPSTVDGYMRCCLYLSPALAGRRVDQVTATDLDRLYANLLKTGLRQREGGLSPRSVRYVHTVLSKALSDGIRKGQLPRNVALMASPPSAKSARAPEMTVWTASQLKKFLAFTSDEALGPLFHVAAMTGMRRGEVVGLRWSDVDFDTAVIRVRQQITTVNGELMVSERMKTDRGQRNIDLDAGTVAVLKGRRKAQAADRLKMGGGWQDQLGLVFSEPDGSPQDPESVAKVFDRRVARCGVPRIRFHDLRHTHVALLIAAGEQPLLVSRRLGHASASFTLDRYGHLFEEAGSQAAAAVAALVDQA
jgi:integrase